ncbi:MAG: hypothetical protein SPL99_10265 [Catonella sp.]|jgi:hypothetical protein|nr:hypothetical protein [Catonella sp.]MDY6357269.1 hypothetical protein [Catonella sp.]
MAIDGYSDEDICKWNEFLQNNAHLIIELANEGWFDHATPV